ncbi:hypothetical protein SAMN05428978_11284 [Nitrosomonas sp. Nm34]|nr:hypothetical protein SAMN05428978_11284 [Nitrosomonas sp. Nm34]
MSAGWNIPRTIAFWRLSADIECEGASPEILKIWNPKKMGKGGVRIEGFQFFQVLALRFLVRYLPLMLCRCLTAQKRMCHIGRVEVQKIIFYN